MFEIQFHLFKTVSINCQKRKQAHRCASLLLFFNEPKVYMCFVYRTRHILDEEWPCYITLFILLLNFQQHSSSSCSFAKQILPHSLYFSQTLLQEASSSNFFLSTTRYFTTTFQPLTKTQTHPPPDTHIPLEPLVAR